MGITRYGQIIVVDTQASLPPSAQMGDFAYAQDTKLSFTFDGTIWNPSSRILVKKGVNNVNGKVTGSTLIYTLEQSTFNFVPLFIHVKAINVSGVLTPATITVGTNPTNYDNILSSTALDSLLVATGLSKTYNAAQAKAVPSLEGGTAIYTRVNALGAAAATNYTVRLDIMGYYEQP